MTEAVSATILDGMAPVSLAELDASASLMTRRDRKYLVPLDVAERLVEQLAALSRVLEIDGLRAFRYRSVYFDTPELASFYGAALRRPNRYKVRTRAYPDAGACLLEVKTRDARGQTVKERVPHALAEAGQLGSADSEFVASFPLIAASATSLQPVLATSYTRSTLLLPEDVRVTIDTGLRAQGPDDRVVALPGMAVVETKSGGPPTRADRVLWDLGHRPIKVSKFGTSLSALYPELPHNKWTQALRRPWAIEDGSPLALAG